MKRVLALLLCLLMFFGVTACGDDVATQPIVPTTTTTTIETVPKAYAHNEVINRFFVNFVELHKGKYLDIASIRRAPATAGISTNGKELTEEELNKEKEKLTKVYLATINECAVTITDVSEKTYSSGVRYALQIEISGGSTIKSRDALFLAFAKIAQAADSDCSSLAVERITAQLEEAAQVMTREMQVSPRVWIASYAPIIENEEMAVSVPCRMVLRVTDPLVTDDTVTTTSATK